MSIRDVVKSEPLGFRGERLRIDLLIGQGREGQFVCGSSLDDQDGGPKLTSYSASRHLSYR